MTSDSDSSKTNISGHVQADLKSLGKYEIVRKIGAGGMGTVFLAQDKHLNRTVALKVLPKDRAENPILVRRFQSEARASAMLTHDNIVAVFDADQADGYLYIALEYIDGIDLFEWLRKRERIPVKRSIDIIKQVTAALQHAHEKNLVHRDIKPANIMITKEGLVKLADMGLARSVDESLDTTITRDGTTVGTVDYMSPEQAAHSKNTDIRSDIYSLGCTWYHMLAGEPPFPEGSLTNKLAAHAKSPPPDPRDFNENVTEAIVAIIHRMMAKKKEDRYQTPTELLEDLNNSTNLESDSGNLLAMLLAEDELDEAESAGSESLGGEEYVLVDSVSELDDEDDSVDFEVQDEPQSDLLKKPKRQPTPETNPQLPTSQKRKKTKEKKTKPILPPKAERSPAPTETPKSKESSRPVRKPLKRVQSAQELNESHSSGSQKQSSPRKARKSQQAEPEEVPQKQKIKAKKQKKSKTVKSKRSKPEDSKAKKTQAATRKSQRPTTVKDQPLEPQSKQTGLGIDIDWGRAGLVILVAGLALFGIWWGVSKFGGVDLVPGQNPYEQKGEETATAEQQNTVDTDTVEAGQKNPGEDGPSVVDVLVQPVVQSEDDDVHAPEWIVSGWAKPTNEERKTFTVQRGTQRNNSFRTLENALGKVDTQTGTIDLSQLSHASLSHVELKLKEKLRIVASNSQTILAFNSSQDSKSPSPWLSVSGGTLELQGLNFVVTNLNKQPLEFLRLDGTDLILRNCTFTSIGGAAVEFIGVHGQSSLSNRIYIENSFFRGENISSIRVDKVPCDLFSENTMFASQKNQLVRIEQDAKSTKQTVQIKNCTFVGGSAALAVQALPKSETLNEVDLTVKRSLFIGDQQSPSTAIHLNNQSPEIDERPKHLSLNLLHTRFVNIDQLMSIKSEEDVTTAISEPSAWNSFWSATLPSDDVISDHDLGSLPEEPMTLSASALEMKIREINRPGVGERSLIGVNADQVAAMEAEAIQRQLVMNHFEDLQSSMKPLEWSEKTVRFDLNNGAKLNAFLASDKCPDGSTVVCFGAGLRKLSPVILKERKLRIQFEQTEGTPLSVVSTSDAATSTMFSAEGGILAIENGPFQITKSRAANDGTLFLQTSGGARVQLLRSHISAPLTASGANQLISCSPNSDVKNLSTIEVTDSMLNGSGRLINLNASGNSLLIKNSILASSDNLLSVAGANETGMILLEQSTLSAGKAIIDCRGSQAPIETLAIGSVFAQPLESSAQNSLLSGSSVQAVNETLNWWESACAYSGQISTPVRIDGNAIAGSFDTAWNRFWGPHHIYDPLTGPQAVVFTKEITGLNTTTPTDFELQQTGLSATWRADGNPIGAKAEDVGPQFQKKKPASSTQPGKVNTPSGF